MNDFYAHLVCSSYWHDEGHASHSACPSCGGRGMRREEEERARRGREIEENRARTWAVTNGWTPPVGDRGGGVRVGP